MKFALILICLSLASAAAQTAAPADPVSGPAASSTAVSDSMNLFLPNLDRLQAASAQALTAIGHLQIDRWKADSRSKLQAENNVNSLQRNLTAALPGLIDAVRAAPQDLPAAFRLYRNLNALHDVFGSLTELAGAFGPRSDYQALAQQFQTIASVRHDLGEALESLTVSTQRDLDQLRAQARSTQQVTAPPTPPKKVIVDDTAPASKTVRKKKTPTSNSGEASGQTGSNAGTGTTPKS